MTITNRIFGEQTPQSKIKELNHIIDELRNAMTYVIDANQKISEALSNTEYDNHYQAYGQYGFQQLMGNGGKYDSSIYDIIGNLRNEIKEIEEQLKNELNK
tara:strand:+ start:9717 stop:10019 length:303 start_codon:yes stop_codon:yes gene_type:complete